MVGRSGAVSTKPVTSPLTGSQPSGPCLAGTAVTCSGSPPAPRRPPRRPGGPPRGAGPPPPQAGRPGRRRERQRCRREEVPARPVQVVGVLIVRQQHRVGPTDLGSGERRRPELRQRRPAPPPGGSPR